MKKERFTIDAWLQDMSRKVVDEDGDSIDPRVYSLGWLLERQDRLFIVTPEPELTSWQTFISGCLQKYGLLDCGAADRIAKECSAELLALARKELSRQGNIVLSIEEFEKRYVKAQEKGRKEAMKDLPRWRKVKGARGYNYSQEAKFSINGRYLEMNDTLNDIYEISFDELEKLSRL